jgi:SAM-dependent methyltransferase
MTSESRTRGGRGNACSQSAWPYLPDGPSADKLTEGRRTVVARCLYNTGYCFFRMPWEIGPRPELMELVQIGRLHPGRAIDLGCGTGANAIYLAEHGFTVTGVDFAPAALAGARRKAHLAGVGVHFVEGDLTDLPARLGIFDLLGDYGIFDDLDNADRTRYV